MKTIAFSHLKRAVVKVLDCREDIGSAPFQVRLTITEPKPVTLVAIRPTETSAREAFEALVEALS